MSDAAVAASPRRLRMTVIGPILALVLLVIAGALMNPNFLGWDNVTNVLARSAFIGIIAVGMTFVITAGGLDLSVGSMAAFIAGLMILVICSPPMPCISSKVLSAGSWNREKLVRSSTPTENRPLSFKGVAVATRPCEPTP